MKNTYITKETKEWHARIRKALRCINESGLWQNKKQYFENMLKMSWEDKKSLDKYHWRNSICRTGENIVTKEQIKELYQKYPFAFDENQKGDDDYCINIAYIYEISDVRLVKINIPQHEKEKFKKSIAENKKFRITDYGSTWDKTLSFAPANDDDYRDDIKRAWWSVEYAGTGNGRYYLALNADTALFCEND